MLADHVLSVFLRTYFISLRKMTICGIIKKILLNVVGCKSMLE